jgi:transcriptional regulator with XRE-family HTH domain
MPIRERPRSMAGMFDCVGKALSIIRQERGVSQEKLATTCRIGRSQLSRYESGRELMRLDTLEKMLNALHVAPEQFFRLVSSLDGSIQPQAPQARPPQAPGLDAYHAAMLREALTNLASAIDELRKAVDGSRHEWETTETPARPA